MKILEAGGGGWEVKERRKKLSWTVSWTSLFFVLLALWGFFSSEEDGWMDGWKRGREEEGEGGGWDWDWDWEGGLRVWI